MTSCDNNIAKYILPQLASIEKNCKNYDVHFFLFHNRISPENINMIKVFIKQCTHITFHEVKIQDIAHYENIAECGGQWPFEAYFTIRVQDHIPEDVDRILYIDAGDVIFAGDIAPYYFDDFEGKSILATAIAFKENRISGKNEIYTIDDANSLGGRSLFNSGSYVINVEKFRTNGYTMYDYLCLALKLCERAKEKSEPELPYFGDQGLLSTVFAGDIKYFGYPQIRDLSYMPYNFRSSYWGLYRSHLSYTPVILHYAIIAKPWIMRFSPDIIDTVIASPDFPLNHVSVESVSVPLIAYLTPQHCKLCEMWWEYAKDTPIYEEADLKAKISADFFLKFYIPLFNDFNMATAREGAC